MSFRFEIAIELETRIPKVEWRPARVRPFWDRKLQLCDEPFSVGVVMTEPSELAGQEFCLTYQSETDFGWSLLQEFPTDEILVILGFVRDPAKRDSIQIDPWILRDRLLRNGNSPEEWVGFLNQCGEWSPSTRVGGFPKERQKHFRFAPVLECGYKIFPLDQFLADRDFVAQVLEGGHLNWPVEEFAPPLALQFRRKFPHFLLNANFCRDAILQSVVLDFMHDVKYKICAWCKRPFEVKSNHKKKYCDYACAHADLMRKKRNKG